MAGGLLAGCSSGLPFVDLGAGSRTKLVQVFEDDATVSRKRAYQNKGRDQSAERQKINRLIAKYAARHRLPEHFVHRVVMRESTYRPNARNGIHLGLMQLNPQTARTMGYRGDNLGLLDAETNLKYGVKYLAGAYLVAKGNEDYADRLYQTGYYYHAKRMGLLRETGLRP